MSKISGLTLFSGGGGVEIGLRHLVDFVGGVEFDPQIASHCQNALGTPITVADVRSVDYSQWAGIEYLHASPPCTRASVANSNSGETQLDHELADAIIRAIATTFPKYFTLENVPGYAKFESFKKIVSELERYGYMVDWKVYDAADYGVPQHRRRICLRAERFRLSPFPALPKTHGTPEVPWIGWYAAVEDLIPTLPESKLANWQVNRLVAKFGENWMEVLIGGGSGRGTIPTARTTDPSITIKSTAKEPTRAVLLAGEAAGKGSTFLNQVVPRQAGAESPALSPQAGDSARKALLVEGDACGERPPTTLPPPEPIGTLRCSGGGRVYRAILVGGANRSQSFLTFAQEHGKCIPGVKEEDEVCFGLSATTTLMSDEVVAESPYRVVSMTPRCLARFQSVPDSYILPEKKSLATTIIGNMVPPLLAEVIFGEGLLKQ